MSSKAPSSLRHDDEHNRSGRLRRFVRADGRSVHVASSPAEAEGLRRRLRQQEEDQDFDLYIHGSPEHLDALRELHSHHEERRNALREQHSAVYDEFEHVHAELDALSRELHMVTDRGVALDANFSKFGYNAHLRTHDSGSSSNSVSNHDWEAERRNGRPMKFWKKPVVRQYFHKGLLWRASEVEEVASFELFVDLLYVGIIAINGDKAAADPTGLALLRFAVTFILSWKLWSDLTLVISWFETDDIVQRILVLFFMACLFGYTTNIDASFDTTYSQLLAFYLTQRLFGAVYYLWVAYLVPMVHGCMIGNALLVVVPSSLWIASIYVEEPRRDILVWIAIVLDLFGSSSLMILMRPPTWVRERIGDWITKHFDFVPAVNIEHKTERMNAFVGLVFGYSVVALLYQNRAPFGMNAFFGKAILGLIQAFSFNWLYFEIDSFNLHTHAIRRHYWSAFTWLSVHIPFVMSFILAAASLSHLVLVHDCPDAGTESLTEAYTAKSEAEITVGLRWFYCAGLGIALACMGIISLSHVHKEFEGQRIRKRHRLALRFAVAIIFICLSFQEHLTSLGLIATTTGLTVLVLATDLLGSTCVHEGFWQEKRSCSYAADCKVRKEDIENAAKTGELVKVQELAKDEKATEKGFYDL